MKQHSHIPTTIFDNFFDDPDKIRKWALSLEYHATTTGNWPGLRTKFIHEIDEPFFNYTCMRVLAQFYDITKENVTWNAMMQFQLVDKKYGSGWVHSDESGGDITGLIYLSPDCHIGGGTSIYQTKQNVIQSNNDNLSHKISFFLDKANHDQVENFRQENNSQFEETISISNVYNRLLCFDSHLCHSAQEYFGEGEESRLTLVFFMSNIRSNNTPVSRVRRVPV